MKVLEVFISPITPASPLHNDDIVSVNVVYSVHINHCPCMDICDTLMRDLPILTYIILYLYVDECWLTSCMPQQIFDLHIFHQVLLITMVALTWSGYISLCSHHISVNNGRHNAACLTGFPYLNQEYNSSLHIPTFRLFPIPTYLIHSIFSYNYTKVLVT